MPDPNLQSYIASHYLSGPKADAILARNSDIKVKRKKKKPKVDDATTSAGLLFKDDSDSWKAVGAVAEEDEDGLTPQIVDADSGSSSKAFRKIGSSKRQDEAFDSAEAAKASEEPTFKAGLRTKEEMKAARLAREQRKSREATQPTTSPTSNPATEDDEALAQQTVYRDASGRVIDIEAHEAEQQRLEQQQAAKAAERSTWSQGLIQKQQRAAASAELSAVKQQGIARRATDQEYNRHFKEQLREDDPALAFLTKKRDRGPQKPTYKGGWPPNRFGIAPGYRWDGVDRGNGFEKAFFERKSVLARREEEARAWGQSDM